MSMETETNEFAQARATMSTHLSTDDGIYQAYHDNVSLKIQDYTILNRPDANELTAQILRLIFDLKQRE
jgi:hypothetical protein